MARTVRVKVTSSGAVKHMNEDAARRLSTTSPNEYKILEEPKVEVLNLPPATTTEPQKKSVIVAEDDKVELQNTGQLQQLDADGKRKPGRSKQNT